MGVRSMVGSQLSELSRSNFELARQMNDLGKRLSSVEGRVEGVQHRARAAIDPLAVEISELGTLVQATRGDGRDLRGALRRGRPSPSSGARARRD